MEAAKFLNTIERELGCDFFAGVPDSLLQPLCDELVARHGWGPSHVVAADEGGAVALAAGHWLATGRPGMVYLQNSGIGNAVNPLCSLTDPAVYGIPVLLVVGWRGEPGVHDEPQHVFQGQISRELLECVGLEVLVVGEETGGEELAGFLRDARDRSERGASSAILVRKGALTRGGRVALPTHGERPLTRERAVEVISALLPADVAVVSTTGKLSRELFEVRERRGEGHGRDLLTVGSMGHSSMIGLGVALAQPGRRVVVLDGDGALIMHTGAMAVVGQRAPRNLVHVAVNNGAHETVGGMPTASAAIDWRALATSVGYRRALLAEDEAGLRAAVDVALMAEGPTFVEVRTSAISRSDLGRPTTSARENGEAFARFLGEEVGDA